MLSRYKRYLYTAASHTVIVDDQETRAKLLELEARLGGVEGGVKEALDLSKHSVKTGSTTGEHWRNKIACGSSALTIKSSDGQDVTSLIDQPSNSAISHPQKRHYKTRLRSILCGCTYCTVVDLGDCHHQAEGRPRETPRISH